jgi:hypothetical protein
MVVFEITRVLALFSLNDGVFTINRVLEQNKHDLILLSPIF